MYLTFSSQGLEKGGFARSVLADKERDWGIKGDLPGFPKNGEIEWIAVRRRIVVRMEGD
jgi:hypothetical protein